VPGVEIVHANGNEQYRLRNDPLHCPKFDVACVRRERETEDFDFRKDKVGRRLAIGCDEGRPGRTTPPGDDEPKEPTVTTSTGFCCPEVDRARGWESGAYFSEHCGCIEDEDACHEIVGPAVLSVNNEVDLFF